MNTEYKLESLTPNFAIVIIDRTVEVNGQSIKLEPYNFICTPNDFELMQSKLPENMVEQIATFWSVSNDSSVMSIGDGEEASSEIKTKLSILNISNGYVTLQTDKYVQVENELLKVDGRDVEIVANNEEGRTTLNSKYGEPYYSVITSLWDATTAN